MAGAAHASNPSISHRPFFWVHGRVAPSGLTSARVAFSRWERAWATVGTIGIIGTIAHGIAAGDIARMTRRYGQKSLLVEQF